MKQSAIERAGIADVSRIYEGLHLSDGFIEKSVREPENLESEFKEEGDRHFNICEKCREKQKSIAAEPEQKDLSLEYKDS